MSPLRLAKPAVVAAVETVTHGFRSRGLSLQASDHPGLPENHDYGCHQQAKQNEHHRPHADTQDRVGLVNVDVASDAFAVDDAGPIWIPAFQDPGLNPTGKSRLPKQVAHDFWMFRPNIRQLPHAFPESVNGWLRSRGPRRRLPV